MATFEAGNATAPSATDPASAAFMWPLFFATNATQTSGVVDVSQARAKRHISHEPNEHTKRRAT